MESTLRFAAKLKDTLIDPGKTNIKGAVPAVEHGGRAREVGTLQGI